MTEIDLELLRSNSEPFLYSLSLGYGSSHLVVTFTDERQIFSLLEFLTNYKPERGAEWIDIGSFGNNPATLYCAPERFSLIVDGNDCGDGSSQSFGIHFASDKRPKFISALASKMKELFGNTFPEDRQK